MPRCWRRGLLLLLLLLGWGAGACAPPESPVMPVTTAMPRPTAPLRLFWVNSYTADDVWAAQIRSGIMETLTRHGYTPGETLIFGAYHFDARQYASIGAAREMVGAAIAAIQDFGPDIVVVSDDEAAQLVIPAYPEAALPIVFCGVTGDPEIYGLLRPNVTGVLERPRPVETTAIARAFIESAERYIILGDTSPTGGTLAVYVYEALNQVDEAERLQADLRLARYWAEWQAVILDDAPAVDFILLLNFDSVLDRDRQVMDQSVMMTWMLENSPVPIFALSRQAVLNGAVGGLVTSGEEQGKAAGRLVIQIAQGTHPSTLSIDALSGYRLLMNLAAVRHWDLRIPVAMPLAAEVYRTLPASSQGEPQ